MKRWFCEGLRRQRVIGLVCAALCALLMVTLRLVYPDDPHSLLNSGEIPVALYGVAAVPSFWIAAVLPPLLVLRAFNFLNKREGSDFHFAQPTRRVPMYVSLWASAMVWALLSLVVSVLVGGQMNLECAKLLLSRLALCMLTGGAAALAAAVTGTRLSGLATLAVVLFLPRLLLNSFTSALFYQLPMLWEENYPWLDQNLNLLLAERVYSVGALSGNLYTSVLGAVYALLGGVAFARRPAEAAEHPMTNRFMQGVCRVGVAMLVCVPAYAEGDRSFFLLAVIVYFVYELISTRQVRALWRALPGLAVVVLLNVAFFSGLALCRTQVLSFVPQAQEIQSVRFLTSAFGNKPNYYPCIENASHVEVHDVVVLKLVEQVNMQEVITVRKEEFPYDLSYSCVVVAIEADGKTAVRRLWLTEKESESLCDRMLQDDAYLTALTTLPPPEKAEVTFFSVLEGSERTELYACFYEELQALTPRERADVFELTSNNYGYQSALTLHWNGQSILMNLRFLPGKLPKTEKMIFEKRDYGTPVEREKVVQYLRRADELSETTKVYYRIENLPIDGFLMSRENTHAISKEERVKPLTELLAGQINAPAPEANELRIKVDIYRCDDPLLPDGKEYTACAWFSLAGVEIPEFLLE